MARKPSAGNLPRMTSRSGPARNLNPPKQGSGGPIGGKSATGRKPKWENTGTSPRRNNPIKKAPTAGAARGRRHIPGGSRPPSPGWGISE